MPLKVTKVEVWAVEIRDEPGGLADVLSAVAQAGGSLDCVIARRQADKFRAGVVFLTPIKGKKVEQAAKTIGAEHAEELATLRIEGPDSRGLGARVSRAIADAGINMRGLSTMKCGRNFVAYLGFDTEADADAASKAIKRLSGPAAGAGRRKRASRA